MPKNSGTKKLNPFYIEQPPSYQQENRNQPHHHQQQWEGDFDDWSVEDHDDEDEEELGLLRPQHQRAATAASGYHHNESPYHHHPHSSWRWTSPKGLCVIFSSLTLIFWILLEALAGSPTPTTTTDSRDHLPPTNSTTTKDDDDSSSNATSTIPPAIPGNKTDENPPADKVPPAASPNNNNNTDANLDTSSTTEESSNTRFVILGERHSGLEWLMHKLSECYPEVSVKSGISRGGYWFQDEESDATDAVVLVLVRDPYDWMQRMWLEKPIHMPAHYNRTEPLNLKQFAEKPWAPSSDSDLAPAGTATDVCQLHFRKDQVIPCQPNMDMDDDTTPVYELDSSGQVFGNIMKLRAAKLTHWLDQIPGLWGINRPVITVHYESGLTEDVMNTIADQSSSDSRNCSGQPPIDDPVEDPKLKKQLSNPKYLEWMHGNVDWEIEQRVGYENSVI